MKLSSALPGKEDLDKNGLTTVARIFVERPDSMVVAVVVLSTKKLTTDLDDGSIVPTVAVRYVEPIRSAADLGVVRQVIDRAYADRTGQEALPLELTEALPLDDDLFRIAFSLDTATGVIEAAADDDTPGEVDDDTPPDDTPAGDA